MLTPTRVTRGLQGFVTQESVEKRSWRMRLPWCREVWSSCSFSEYTSSVNSGNHHPAPQGLVQRLFTQSLQWLYRLYCWEGAVATLGSPWAAFRHEEAGGTDPEGPMCGRIHGRRKLALTGGRRRSDNSCKSFSIARAVQGSQGQCCNSLGFLSL